MLDAVGKLGSVYSKPQVGERKLFRLRVCVCVCDEHDDDDLHT